MAYSEKVGSLTPKEIGKIINTEYNGECELIYIGTPPSGGTGWLFKVRDKKLQGWSSSEFGASQPEGAATLLASLPEHTPVWWLMGYDNIEPVLEGPELVSRVCLAHARAKLTVSS